MAFTDWMIQGSEIANCNCAYGCPCQFNALPTNGNCRATMAIQIDKGHYGDVKLDGLRMAAVVAWPGPIHMGGGEVQPIVDERATEEQRAALLAILSGADTEPGATIFQVFSTVIDTVHEPLFKHIDYSADQNARTGKFAVPGSVDVSVESIRNPVTGAEHRARVTLPTGFEYTVAEFASGTAKTEGKIMLDHVGTHAHLAKLHMTGQGVVH